MSERRVDFLYDFVCPYAYLAHTQIEGLAAREGAVLTYCPFLLGGVFRALGTPDVPAAAMSAAKARLNALDMHRWADLFGVPLRMPEGHPRSTVLALRAALAAPDLPRASKALFNAYWAQGRDLSLSDVVRDALDGAGLDGAALVAHAEAPEIKQELRARTDAAVEAGVFGAPTFLVTGPAGGPHLIWGQDRLHFVEQVLRGWAPPRLEGLGLEGGGA